jgi:hypothetical protein
MKRIVGTVAIGALFLAVSAFTANAATKTPPGFYEGKAEWKNQKTHRTPRPPGWNKGEKEGWGRSKTPPGLNR